MYGTLSSSSDNFYLSFCEKLLFFFNCIYHQIYLVDDFLISWWLRYLCLSLVNFTPLSDEVTMNAFFPFWIVFHRMIILCFCIAAYIGNCFRMTPQFLILNGYYSQIYHLSTKLKEEEGVWILQSLVAFYVAITIWDHFL
jgi:hypothetical protein